MEKLSNARAKHILIWEERPNSEESDFYFFCSSTGDNTHTRVKEKKKVKNKQAKHTPKKGENTEGVCFILHSMGVLRTREASCWEYI